MLTPVLDQILQKVRSSAEGMLRLDDVTLPTQDVIPIHVLNIFCVQIILLALHLFVNPKNLNLEL
jgi:hypothetical protein